MAERLVPKISLKDYENHTNEIREQLVSAAEGAGFLTLVDHGITIEEIEAQFALSKQFFDLPLEIKRQNPHSVETNNGYEFKSQVRPKWPSDENVPGFRKVTENFLTKCEAISDKVLSCFAIALGFLENYFRIAMDPNESDCLTQMRLLHYPASDNAVGTWRAGVHTDIGCLTLLFQRTGEDGLEIRPGRESSDTFAFGSEFTPLPAETGLIVVNIGDMLMAWSDDRLKANFHRVRAKEVGKSPDRYSIAYFNTGRKNFHLQGPEKKYPPITCGEYFTNHVKKQFGALAAYQAAEAEKERAGLVSAAA